MEADCSIFSATQLLKFLDSLFKLHKLNAIRAKDIAEIRLELSCKIPYVNITLPFPEQDFFSLFESVIVMIFNIQNLNNYYLHSEEII